MRGANEVMRTGDRAKGRILCLFGTTGPVKERRSGRESILDPRGGYLEGEGGCFGGVQPSHRPKLGKHGRFCTFLSVPLPSRDRPIVPYLDISEASLRKLEMSRCAHRLRYRTAAETPKPALAAGLFYNHRPAVACSCCPWLVDCGIKPRAFGPPPASRFPQLPAVGRGFCAWVPFAPG